MLQRACRKTEEVYIVLVSGPTKIRFSFTVVHLLEALFSPFYWFKSMKLGYVFNSHGNSHGDDSYIIHNPEYMQGGSSRQRGPGLPRRGTRCSSPYSRAGRGPDQAQCYGVMHERYPFQFVSLFPPFLPFSPRSINPTYQEDSSPSISRCGETRLHVTENYR